MPAERRSRARGPCAFGRHPQRLGTDVAAADLHLVPRAPCLLPHADADVATPAAHIEHPQRPLSVFIAQRADRPPQERRDAADPVDALQADIDQRPVERDRFGIEPAARGDRLAVRPEHRCGLDVCKAIGDARGDGDGVNAVLADAGQYHRCVELVLAVLGLYQLLLPNITDDNIIDRIQQLAVTWAANDETERQS